MKTVPTVDWPELEGIEPNLLNPRLAPKNGFSISFYCVDAPYELLRFGNMLRASNPRTFEFRKIGLSVPLRYKSTTASVRTNGLELFSMEFSLDATSINDWKTYTNLSDITPSDHGYTTGMQIDSVDFANYGIIPAKGGGMALETPAPAKENVIKTSDTINGLIYDDNVVVKGARSVTLPFLLRESTKSRFWRYYLALLNKLSTAGNHTLTWNGNTYYFYYQSQSVSYFKYFPDGAIWCAFNLTLMIYK